MTYMPDFEKPRMGPRWPKDQVLICIGQTQGDSNLRFWLANDEPNFARGSRIGGRRVSLSAFAC